MMKWTCCGAVLDVMELGEPDESGRRRPQTTGENYYDRMRSGSSCRGSIAQSSCADSIDGLELGRKNTIAVNEEMQSSIPTIYAGGDIVRGGATVILAMGDGRKAALNMANALLKE